MTKTKIVPYISRHHLTGKLEKKCLYEYEYFGDGRIVDLMPQLIEAGYEPAGIAVIIDRRQNAPEEIRANYDRTFWTGDSGIMDNRYGVLLTLDSPLLRQLTSETTLVDGQLPKLKPAQWRELKKDKEHSLYLTPEEVEAAHNKGYVLKNRKFVPENKTVAKIWDHLIRGRDLYTYIQMVKESLYLQRISQFKQQAEFIYPMVRPELKPNFMKDAQKFAFKNIQVKKMMTLDMKFQMSDSEPLFNSLCCISLGSVYKTGSRICTHYMIITDKGGCLVGITPKLSVGELRTRQGEVSGVQIACEAQNGGPIQRSELEAILDEFKLKDAAELRKALQLYNAQFKKPKKYRKTQHD